MVPRISRTEAFLNRFTRQAGCTHVACRLPGAVSDAESARPRARLHELVDELTEASDKAWLHASVDALPDAEVSDALSRMLLFHGPTPEWFRSTERDDLS